MANKELMYTIVEHNGLKGFAMLSSVQTSGQARKIVKAGGLIVNTYEQADKLEQLACYADKDGLVKDRGHFSRLKHLNDRIFIPSGEFREKFLTKTNKEVASHG